MIVTLGTAGTMGLALASYLALTSSQHASTERSLTWNLAIPIAEAGIEEAFTHLYFQGQSNMTVNGWSLVGNDYVKQRWLGSNYYTVSISTNVAPTIIAEGFVRLPRSTNYVSRRVQVTASADARFARAMVAKGAIDLNGQNVETDSFDSTDPNLSTNGRYDPAKARDNGDVATNSQLLNSLNVGNANIHGRVATGPGGSVNVGPNGAVGSDAWHAAGNNGIQPGYYRDDMNLSFPDVQAPFSGAGLLPGAGNYMGTNYSLLLGTGNYKASSIGFSGHKKIMVIGHAVLWVTSSFSLSGNSSVIIAPGASLKLYVGDTSGTGASASIGGNGVANNGFATDFFYYGLPSNTSLSYSGNADFTGVVYAPNAHFSLGGGGTTIYDFVGACVSKSVLMNGHFHFHYDEALSRIGPRGKYVINSWNEV
jgi:hypothetical protein